MPCARHLQQDAARVAQLAQARQVRVQLGQRLVQLLPMQVQLRAQLGVSADALPSAVQGTPQKLSVRRPCSPPWGV